MKKDFPRYTTYAKTSQILSSTNAQFFVPLLCQYFYECRGECEKSHDDFCPKFLHSAPSSGQIEKQFQSESCMK